MFFQLVKQMAEQEGITEQLKADSQMEWVGQMKQYPFCGGRNSETQKLYLP